VTRDRVLPKARLPAAEGHAVDVAGVPLAGAQGVERAVLATLGLLEIESCRVAVAFVDESEGRRLNQAYRGREAATNVLSFPCDERDEEGLRLLGDIVVCNAVALREATHQGKTIAAHASHLLVHGTLHLLGYDHVEVGQADQMESLEQDIMRQLGFDDPYLINEVDAVVAEGVVEGVVAARKPPPAVDGTTDSRNVRRSASETGSAGPHGAERG
jgi:probable rRNA maturation factor